MDPERLALLRKGLRSGPPCFSISNEAAVELLADRDYHALRAGGCSACEHAAFRFNGGAGATTCAMLDDLIVAYGSGKPTSPPEVCPLVQESER